MMLKESPKKLETALKNGGFYIQNKYAVENSLLVSLCSLDPLICHAVTYSHVLKMFFFYFTLTSSENSSHISDISSYQIDYDLPTFIIGDLDVW